MIKLLQYLWNGILLIVSLCTLCLLGIFIKQMLIDAHSFVELLVSILFGSIIIGCIAVLGYILYIIINDKDSPV